MRGVHEIEWKAAFQLARSIVDEGLDTRRAPSCGRD
jgi:hypothetical protein